MNSIKRPLQNIGFCRSERSVQRTPSEKNLYIAELLTIKILRCAQKDSF